jgi:hypothetical protein
MEPSAEPPPTEESSVPASRSSLYGFAAILAIFGSAAFAAASVLPYATSAGQAQHLVEFDAPLKDWVWAAIQLWGTALVILITAALLITSLSHPVLLAGLLIAFGVETALLSGPSLGQILVTDNVDPGSGGYLAAMSGLIVLWGGILAFRTWRSTSVST